MGIADDGSRMYQLSHFLPYSLGNALMSHANETKNIWNEKLGHLNYRYLQALSKENMVEGLPSIKFSKGTCKGCIVGKHVEHKDEKGKTRRVVQVLELIHSDMICPIPTLSYVKSRYFLTFIDIFQDIVGCFSLSRNMKCMRSSQLSKLMLRNFMGRR